MERILVMGSSGSGKSTFAHRLSAIIGIPTVSLDALFWKPGWVESDATEFGRRVTEAAQQGGHGGRAHAVQETQDDVPLSFVGVRADRGDSRP